MKGPFTVCILAAGWSVRMGASHGKPFLYLCGEPVLMHTLRCFIPILYCCSHVLIAVRAEDEERAQQCIQHFTSSLSSPCHIRMVRGGATRQESAREALSSVETPWVLMHDAARPFVPRNALERLLIKAEQGIQAATLAIPVVDTLKQVDEQERIMATLPRQDIRLIQTPQIFATTLLRRAHERALACGQTTTDDTALVEMLGEPVHAVPGDPLNFKLTVPQDLIRATLTLQMMSSNGEEGTREVGGAYNVSTDRPRI